MILVDEYSAILVISGSAPESLTGERIALSYGRAYRLTRALMDVGPGRLHVRGRFTRNTYAVSLLQAETLVAAAHHDWPVRFGDPDSTTPPSGAQLMNSASTWSS